MHKKRKISEWTRSRTKMHMQNVPRNCRIGSMLAIAQHNSRVGGAIMNGFAQNHETEKSEHHFYEEHPRVEGNTTPRPPARVAHCTLNLLLREGSSLGSICRSTLRQWSNELVRKEYTKGKGMRGKSTNHWASRYPFGEDDTSHHLATDHIADRE